MHFLEKLKELHTLSSITFEQQESLVKVLTGFYYSYETAVVENGHRIENSMPQLNKFLELVKDQIAAPYSFGIYHERELEPFDYYRFGLDFLRPIIRMDQSTVLGIEHLEEIQRLVQQGDNVILFSNHQTEPDPQAISLMLEHSQRNLAEQMIFVAGHRVTTDPLAVPFSKGRNLFCIYSKNYIESPPEKKREKVLHNQRAMRKMRDLLGSGGKCIYVAPSGGRDRLNEEGVIEISPFDPQSIEMFYFAAKHSSKDTHFYPLALFTYDLLPPPSKINVELGELRHTKATKVHLGFGDKIFMDEIPGLENVEKHEKRVIRAQHIWEAVNRLYSQISPDGN